MADMAHDDGFGPDIHHIEGGVVNVVDADEACPVDGHRTDDPVGMIAGFLSGFNHVLVWDGI